MKKTKKLKCLAFIIAILILAVVSFIKPEYTENVARAFLILLGVGL